MADVLGEMVVKIVGDSKSLDKTLDKSEKKLDDLGSTGTKTSKTLAKAGALIQTAFVAAIVAGVAKIGKELITAASAAEETRNKFNVVFKDVAEDAEAAADNLADNFGLSQTAAENLLSSTGDLLTGFGFTGAAALDLSDQVNQLAVDLASFTNFSGGAEGASEALTKALLGERESVKALGISILEADVQAKVLELTQQGLTFETERQAKAYATLKIAQEQSQNAIGDFARSQDSFANQTRIAKAAVDDLSVEIGKNLLPIATDSIKLFGELAGKVAEFVAERNKLAEARTADAEGNATLEQRLLLLQEEIQYEKDLADRTIESGLISKQAAEQVKARSDAKIAALTAELRGISLNLEAEALLSKEERESAAAEAREQAARDAREAERLADIERRNEAWSKTEAGRIAAIEAEIDYYETFKESDEKAQEVLADLRAELSKLTEETEEGTVSISLWGDATLASGLKYSQTIANARKGTRELTDDTEKLTNVTLDWSSAFESGLSATLRGFEDLGQALADGEDGFTAFGKAALRAIAEVIRALAAQLTTQAAVAAGAALAGDAEQIPVAIQNGAGAAAAYTAAGLVDSAAASLAEGGIAMPTPGGTIVQVAEAGQPEVIFPLDKLESMLGGKMGGQTVVFNNLISTGSEAEMRLAARKFYTYLDAEGRRRGGL